MNTANINDKGNVVIRIKDFFQGDRSGVEMLEVSNEAYIDLCEYINLIHGSESSENKDIVEVDVRNLYPHLCIKKKKIWINTALYSKQMEHIYHRKKVLIRISDFYPGNRSEQKFTEISDSILQALFMYVKEEENEKERDKNNHDRNGFDEVSRSEIDGIYAESHEKDIDYEITVNDLFAPYGEKIASRARMYLIDRLSINQIADAENISHEAARKAISLIKKIVKSAGKSYFGML